MVEAEATVNTWNLVKSSGATAPTEEVVAEGLEAAKGFIRTLCEAQSALAEKAAKPTREFNRYLDYQDDVLAAVEKAASADLGNAITIAGKQEREAELDRIKDVVRQIRDQIAAVRRDLEQSAAIAEAEVARNALAMERLGAVEAGVQDIRQGSAARLDDSSG